MAMSQKAMEAQWRAQDALRTLSSAASIQADPKLMRDVKTEAQRQIKTLGSALGGAKPAPAKPAAAKPAPAKAAPRRK